MGDDFDTMDFDSLGLYGLNRNNYGNTVGNINSFMGATGSTGFNVPGSPTSGSSWSWLNQYNDAGDLTQQGVLAPALQGLSSLSGLYFGLQDRKFQRSRAREDDRRYQQQLARMDQDYENQLETQFLRRNQGSAVSSEDLQAYIDERTV